MKKIESCLVDFHAHILPRADHGSDSLDTSLQQLKLADSFGVKRIIATPHFYPQRHTVESFLERRNNAYRELRSATVDGMPLVRLGAEVLICNGIERLEGLEELCIYGTKNLLLELPFDDFQVDYYKSAYKLCQNGYNIILAHADRYDPVNIKKMTDVGAKIQLNASSLAAMFPKKHLFGWIERGLVVAIGSDIHKVDKKAYKNFVSAESRLGEHLSYIAEQSSLLFDKADEL